MKVSKVAFLAMGLLTGLTAANADPVKWDLQNVSLSDGQTVAGSFVFDADTFALTNISIATSGGKFFNTPVNVQTPQGVWVGTGPLGIGTTFIFLFFLPDTLTNAGGTLPLQPGSISATCTAFAGGCSWPTVSTLQVTGFVTTESAVGPGILLEQLSTAVTGATGLGTSLTDKVALARTYFAVLDVQSTCSILDDFLNQVRAQRGKKLAAAFADTLVADAQAITNAIGCN